MNLANIIGAGTLLVYVYVRPAPTGAARACQQRARIRSSIRIVCTYCCQQVLYVAVSCAMAVTAPWRPLGHHC